MKHRYIPIFTILYCILIKPIIGQNENTLKYFEKKNDISVNVTSLLENVLSLGSNEETSLYDIVYRRKFKSSAFRIGTSFNIGNTTTLTPGFENILKDQVIDLKLGWEKHNPLLKNLLVHYGMDLILGSAYSESQVNFNFKNTVNSKTIGGGPVIRFEYKVLPTISIYTEGAIYFRYITSKSVFEDANNIIEDKSKSSYLKSLIPHVLYLAIHF